MPRDTQKSRLYKAEDSIRSLYSETARRLLVDTERVPSTGSVTIEACQNYVDHLTQSAWFQRRWGRRTIRVKHKVYGKARGGLGAITLPPWSRCEAVILHEVAHEVTYGGGIWADHGPEFAGVLLALVEHRMGKDAANTLREAYKKHRVRKNTAALPAPTRTVREPARRVKVPSAAVADKHSQARLAKTKAKPTPGFNFWADDALHEESAYQFWFGSVHALATALAEQEAGRRRSPRVISTQGVEITKRGAKVPVTWVLKAKDEPGVYNVWVLPADGKPPARHHATVVLKVEEAVA